MLDRSEFQAREVNVVNVDVHGRNRAGLVRKIARHCSRRTRSKRSGCPNRSRRLHVDAGVFPDLIVDEAVEPERKDAPKIPLLSNRWRVGPSPESLSEDHDMQASRPDDDVSPFFIVRNSGRMKSG
jgi:hypothetical protein